MFFDDDYQQIDDLDIMIESWSVLKDIEEYEDGKLIDTVVNMQYNVDFQKDTDTIIGQFWKTGKLTEEQRKKLIGAIMLVETNFCMSEGGEVYATKRR